jgi:hypothetical protein
LHLDFANLPPPEEHTEVIEVPVDVTGMGLY